ncbi:MAG: divalent-cation tolerance protein CutA [Deltaproteobacteria bacterium CG11_big_fil_rev_8_21_14_0_20_42_23]|nr:MAG: divalent-cation tolerance protein CutA [Deltaproteobacteria bacterium CG11_big_fil_rev_8_21_14_0_20_42_23]PJC63709.1 MAG: divalent-cation tolerance protein CutA [Deltaproteobacteria bacterium CG_4_9_14_0_2_um_filter_42_21]
MSDASLCCTTTANLKDAKKLAKRLVTKKLASCVQVIPKILSFYEWDGALQEESECLLLIKTPQYCVEEIKDLLRAEHTYEVPEFLVFEASDALEEYLGWMQEAVE